MSMFDGDDDFEEHLALDITSDEDTDDDEEQKEQQSQEEESPLRPRQLRRRLRRPPLSRLSPLQRPLYPNPSLSRSSRPSRL
jgi:hypothetical protein